MRQAKGRVDVRWAFSRDGFAEECEERARKSLKTTSDMKSADQSDRRLDATQLSKPRLSGFRRSEHDFDRFKSRMRTHRDRHSPGAAI